MCYMVRHPQAHTGHGSALPSPGTDRVRPRWVAAGAAALVGGLAIAAYVAPAGAPTVSSQPEAATVAPLAAKSGESPVQPVVDQRSAGIDDGVPGPAEVSKARAGNCQYGM